MTREDIVKAYVWIRKNNSSIPDDVLDFMKKSSLDAIEDKWIKIESENDLPPIDFHTEYWFFDGESRWISVSTLLMRLGKTKVTHYHPIQKPEPPLF